MALFWCRYKHTLFWCSHFGQINARSSPPEVFLGTGVLEVCSNFSGEHPCRSLISIKLQNNFIEFTLLHGCSPVNLLHIFRTLFYRNTSGLLLKCQLGFPLKHHWKTGILPALKLNVSGENWLNVLELSQMKYNKNIYFRRSAIIYFIIFLETI